MGRWAMEGAEVRPKLGIKLLLRAFSHSCIQLPAEIRKMVLHAGLQPVRVKVEDAQEDHTRESSSIEYVALLYFVS